MNNRANDGETIVIRTATASSQAPNAVPETTEEARRATRSQNGKLALEIAAATGMTILLAYATSLTNFNTDCARLFKYLHQPNPLKTYDLNAIANALTVAFAMLVGLQILVKDWLFKKRAPIPGIQGLLDFATGAVVVFASLLAVAAFASPLWKPVFGSAKHTANDAAMLCLLMFMMAAVGIGLVATLAYLLPTKSASKGTPRTQLASLRNTMPAIYWAIATLAIGLVPAGFVSLGLAAVIGWNYIAPGVIAVLAALGEILVLGITGLLIILLLPILIPLFISMLETTFRNM